MIEELLKRDFVCFYNKNPENAIPESTVNVFYNSLKDSEFELTDTNGGLPSGLH
ncbi:hypothetical protein FACS189420_6610 [Bacteroidia bacterium]|nr:hypothetical protein FACS189420_6610 [Bacteroidia bacterium]